ncbi:MAG: GNAT family N-acetyltransferase [Spirochaetota bacterium]
MKGKIREAEEKDIEAIFNLLKQYALQGIILERDREDISNNLHTFIVAEIDSILKGVVTFYDYGENLKEIRSLAIESNSQGMGIGKKLLQSVIERIRKSSKARIFVLTYKPEFFKKNNFVEVSKEEFPEKIWKDCDKCKDRENCSETALIYKG